VPNPAVIAPTQTITITAAGTYALAVNDGGCIYFDTIVVREVLQPNISGTLNYPVNSCNNQQMQFSVNATGNNLSYFWTTGGAGNFVNVFGDLSKSSTAPIPTYIPDQLDTNFLVTLALFNQCDTLGPIAYPVVLRKAPDADFISSKNDGFLNDEITFTIRNPQPDDQTYNWSFGTFSTRSDVFPPQVQSVLFNEFGIYRVRLIVTNAFCSDTAERNIGIIRNQIVYVPNVFSPSAQRVDNQSLKIFGTNISAAEFEFSVYNRWGVLVYRTTSLTEATTVGWTGKADGASEFEPMGVYTYMVKGKFFDGTPFEKIGNSTLIR
jgi:PKD repeat protein